ncbi:MAG: hypothetical protein HY870_11925, partial [Chloroflexi bacterium]|nr:hypothetical protein [Chloroflexota bacterium]
MLVGGHVDPLYEGRLYLVVYNLSDLPIRIKPGTRIARIQFHEVKYEASAEIVEEKLQQFKVEFSSLPDDAISEWMERHLPEVYETMERHSRDIGDLRQNVRSLADTSQFVIWGGVFLIAMAMFGAFLQTIFNTWNSTINLSGAISSLGPQPIPQIIVLLIPIATAAMLIIFTAVVLRGVSKRILSNNRTLSARASNEKRDIHQS